MAFRIIAGTKINFKEILLFIGNLSLFLQLRATPTLFQTHQTTLNSSASS